MKKKDKPKRGPGRPPVTGVTRDVGILIRMTKKERDALQTNAKKSGENVSDFVRRMLGDILNDRIDRHDPADEEGWA